MADLIFCAQLLDLLEQTGLHILQKMDNYLPQEYHPWDQVYLHPSSCTAIFLGNLQAAKNLNFLHSHHITTVITAALGMDQLDYTSMKIKHIIYPLLDHKSQNIAQFFEEFYNIIEKEIRIGSVLVHCSAGVSRSPTLVVSYLMKKEGWSFKQAIQYLRRSRPKILPNLGFERQLKLYQNQLRDNSSTATPRKYYCKTSGTRRSERKIRSTEPFSLNPIKSANFVVNYSCRGSVPKKVDFHVRALKLRSLESRQKLEQTKQQLQKLESPMGNLLTFQVQKLQISSRFPRRNYLRPRLEQGTHRQV